MNVLAALLALLLPAAAMGASPQPFVQGSWSTLLAAHRGHPTIVHFWGVTCGPCLTELPEWGGFAAQHEDIDLVMVDADPVTVAPDDMAAVLAKAGLEKAESWRFADSFTERLEYEVAPNWHGELPFTVLVYRDGSSTSVLGAMDFDSAMTSLRAHSGS